MDQKPSMAPLPNCVAIEKRGDAVRLSWNNQGSDRTSTIIFAVLVTLMLVLSFGWSVFKIRLAEPWVLFTVWPFGGLVGFFLIKRALQWFWVKSIELRQSTWGVLDDHD